MKQTVFFLFFAMTMMAEKVSAEVECRYATISTLKYGIHQTCGPDHLFLLTDDIYSNSQNLSERKKEQDHDQYYVEIKSIYNRGKYLIRVRGLANRRSVSEEIDQETIAKKRADIAQKRILILNIPLDKIFMIAPKINFDYPGVLIFLEAIDGSLADRQKNGDSVLPMVQGGDITPPLPDIKKMFDELKEEIRKNKVPPVVDASREVSNLNKKMDDLEGRLSAKMETIKTDLLAKKEELASDQPDGIYEAFFGGSVGLSFADRTSYDGWGGQMGGVANCSRNWSVPHFIEVYKESPLLNVMVLFQARYRFFDGKRILALMTEAMSPEHRAVFPSLKAEYFIFFGLGPYFTSYEKEYATIHKYSSDEGVGFTGTGGLEVRFDQTFGVVVGYFHGKSNQQQTLSMVRFMFRIYGYGDPVDNK